MSEDRAEGTYYIQDSDFTANGMLKRATRDLRATGWLEDEMPEQDMVPEWMREPVWIIEITVRRA